MKLQEWLKTAGGKSEEGIPLPLSIIKFAKKIQVSPVKVYAILRNQGDLLLSIALRIQKETKGKVQPIDLMEDHQWTVSNRRKIKA
jgi:hypothetical protein